MMREIACALFIVTAFTISSCTSTEKKIEQQMEKYLADSSAAIENNEAAYDSTHASGETDNCARGQATPIVRKEKYPNTTFELQPDSVSGIETVTFDNGDKLVIENTGCEYYILSFRFETSEYQKDTADLGYWFKTVDHKLMTGMLGGINAPIDIKRGLMYLEYYINENPKNLELGKEIDFGGDEIRSFLSVDRISKLSDTRYAVEVTFATGPL